MAGNIALFVLAMALIVTLVRVIPIRKNRARFISGEIRYKEKELQKLFLVSGPKAVISRIEGEIGELRLEKERLEAK